MLKMLYTGVKLVSHITGEHMLRVQGEYSGISWRKYEGTGEHCIMKSFMIGIACWIFVGWSNQRQRGQSIRWHRNRWADNIKMDLQDWQDGMDWIYLAQHRDKWQATVNK